MGNVGPSSKPTNKTGKSVVRQKLENAKKTGVLSLREHKLSEVPDHVFELSNLRTLDISKNCLKSLGNSRQLLARLTNLKSLNCDDNKLRPGSLQSISSLSKLQILSAGGNGLGVPHNDSKAPKVRTSEPLPMLPSSLKQIKLDFNSFQMVPKSICLSNLTLLEKLDLSNNHLAAIPSNIKNLSSLVELNLDQNSIVSLPNEIGELKKLKVLSLKSNNIRVDSTVFTSQNPQPIPATLFSETPVIDLNLFGNHISRGQLDQFDGFDAFLERRKSVKTKNLYGGAMTDLGLCGLES